MRDERDPAKDVDVDVEQQEAAKGAEEVASKATFDAR